MFEACFNKLESVAGRAITKAEREDLRLGYEKRVLTAMQNHTNTPQSAMQEAFNRLVADAEHAKKKAQHRKNLQALALIKQSKNVDAVSVNAGVPKVDALSRLLMKYLDNRTGIRSVEEHASGIYGQYQAALAKVGRALGSRMLGILDRPDAVEAFYKYRYGEQVDPAKYPNLDKDTLEALKDAADTTGAIFETMRQRANKAGADIGKLGYGYMPRSWDSYRVFKVKKSEFVDDAMKHAAPMRDQFDQLLSEDEMRAVFSDMYTTLVTDGMNKGEIVPATGGSIASRGSQHRVVHFKSAADELAMLAKYSGDHVMSSIDSHVLGMARNIALMEQFGPNAELTINTILAKAKADDIANDVGAISRLLKTDALVKAQYAVLAGKGTTVQNQNVAGFFQGLRNLATVKLAKAAVASFFGDPVQYRSQLIIHNWNKNMPLKKRLYLAIGSQVEMTMMSTRLMFDAGLRRQVEMMGFQAEVLSNQLYRDASDMVNSGITRTYSNTVMRGSMLGLISNARREAFRSIAMKGLFDKLQDFNYSDIDSVDAKLIKGAGITETHWKVWKLSKGEDMRGRTILSADSIKAIPDAELEAIAKAEGKRVSTVRRDAIEALIGFITAEDKLGVMEPNMLVQAQKLKNLHGGQIKKGTIMGELTLNLYQFKAFPHAYITMILMGRANMFDGGARYGYMAAMLAASTLCGAIALQASSLLSFKDPENMDPKENPDFWIRALWKGGGLSFYGDFLKAETNWQGMTELTSMLGPVTNQIAMAAGTVLDIGRAAKKGDDEELDKQVTAYSDRWLREFKSMLPTHLWFTSATADRLLYNNLGEALKPGYKQRVEERARDMYGQEHFIGVSDPTDIRAPKMSEAPRNEN